MRKVKIYGDPVLAEKALPLTEFGERISKIGELLLDMMMKYDGVGLAATQIGKKIRMIALNVPLPKKGSVQASLSPGEILLLPRMPIVFINPEILNFSPFESIKEEGCLSVPKIYAPVSRPVSLVFKAGILGGEDIRCECGGLLARAIQHEIDHLDGILFIERLSKEIYEKVKPELEKLGKKVSTANEK